MTTATAITAAEATALELDALGIDHLFLMTGRDNTLWIALQRAGIRQVLARTEAAAVYMADGYARVTGRPTFTYGAYGPGAANVAAAMAEPYWSSSPVIAMCSAMRRMDRYRSEYQEIDQLPLFQSVTKWGVEVQAAAQLPRFIREAARRSLTGTPGPIYLGVPGDIYEEPMPDHTAPVRGEPLEMPLTRPAPTPGEAATVVEAVLAAERPVLLAGNGIHQSKSYEALQLFAERLAIPVATSVAGKGAIADTHPLAIGTVGRYSRRYANEALASADLILAVGTGLGGMVTDSFKLIPKGCRLIHVAVDPDVIGQNFPTAVGILADARAFFEAALEATVALPGGATAAHRTNGHDRPAERNGHGGNGHAGNGHAGNGRDESGGMNARGRKRHPSGGGNGTTLSTGSAADTGTGNPAIPAAASAHGAWLQLLADNRRSWHEKRMELASQDGTDGRPMRPESMMAALNELLDDDAIVCADTGYSSAWGGGLLELRRAGRSFFRADGSLGWAFAGALGAQMAAPSRQVVSIIGDGGFGYQVADIETAVRLGLPTVTVILNNGTLAFEAHVQTLLYDHLVPEVDDFLDVDYGRVARAFGASGVRVSSAPEFRRAVRDALRHDGPTIIDAVIDRDAIAPVTRYDRVRSREL
jgi:thiamine pyrophosphate-dependent acetolactate synthase large subunit-like protein